MSTHFTHLKSSKFLARTLADDFVLSAICTRDQGERLYLGGKPSVAAVDDAFEGFVPAVGEGMPLQPEAGARGLPADFALLP